MTKRVSIFFFSLLPLSPCLEAPLCSSYHGNGTVSKVASAGEPNLTGLAGRMVLFGCDTRWLGSHGYMHVYGSVCVYGCRYNQYLGSVAYVRALSACVRAMYG